MKKKGKKILVTDIYTSKIRVYDSVAKAAEGCNVSKEVIYACIEDGHATKKMGYCFDFVDDE